MKYLGLVEIDEDLISKEYVDFVTKDYVDKSKIDDNSYTRFNAINLIFSMMVLSKTLSIKVSLLTTICDEMYIKNNSNFVRVDTKYKCNNRKDVLKLIKTEKYLYIPNSEVNQFFELLEDKIIYVNW